MNLSSLNKLGLVFLVAGSVGGCGFGLIVPQVGEFYEGTDAAVIRINHIESQIDCEIKEAVRNILYVDETRIGDGRPLPPTLTWLKSWGSTSTLKVTINEKSALNPGVSFLTPMIGATTHFPGNITVPAGQNYNLGIGGTASSEASVDDSSDFSLLFANFLGDRDWKDYLSKKRAGIDTSCWHSGDFLMEGDLGLKEWLVDRLLPVSAENISAPKTSIQRHVFFTIVTSGNITPTWKLVRISTTSSPLAQSGRTRTYDLIVTFGPQNPGATSRESLSVASYKVFVPSQTTLDLHNSALFGSSVAARLTPVLPVFTGLPFIGF